MAWASKLERKLLSLTEASSPESIATVAKWICFNRKQAASFCQVLSGTLAASDRQVLLLELISLVLLNDKESSAWDRGADLRRVMGETVLLPNIDKLNASSRDKLLGLTEIWDEANVFGGPTIIHQIRKLQQSGSLSVLETGARELDTETKPAAAESAHDLPKKRPSTPTKLSRDDEYDAFITQEDDFDLAPLMKKPRATASALMTAAIDTVPYDFESTGISFVKTEPYQLLESCGQVANLQIARDIRNDSAIQLNSLFTALPEDVRRSCAEAAETDGAYALADNDTARDYSIRMNQSLIDMDMNEQLLNLYQLRKLIEQQQEARQNARKLLLQSRCQFGSDEAAAAFYTANRGQGELASRRQIMLDAMELEGCGLEENEQADVQLDTANQDDLEPLIWYKPDAFVDAS
ncbi:hypothetical protein MPSEU_000570300 [Mayamaea pseudoterrestris]|nr:hypothetical protein MPSEU_000570300 [Mayamaea pseudoterrestris]